jgi:hypothetical protein
VNFSKNLGSKVLYQNQFFYFFQPHGVIGYIYIYIYIYIPELITNGVTVADCNNHPILLQAHAKLGFSLKKAIKPKKGLGFKV